MCTSAPQRAYPRLEYEESVEEALCFGWIDSKPNKLDEARSMLWFAPRKPGTGWSKPNKERIERMLRAGRMHPAGLAKIDQAKADGSWTSLDAVQALQVPSDLAQAFASVSVAALWLIPDRRIEQAVQHDGCPLAQVTFLDLRPARERNLAVCRQPA